MGIEEKLPSGILLTTVEGIFGWVRKASFWPVTMGLACCAIEMMAYATPRFDSARWGQEVFRASPRQADLMIVSGRLSQETAPIMPARDTTPRPKDAPVEHSSTMRHLSAWADLRLRAHLMSWPLSSPDNVSSTAAGPLLRPISQEPVKNQK